MQSLQEEVTKLVLSRKVGESVTIDNFIRITYQSQQGKAAKLLIEAPENIRILRTELAGNDERRSDT
jgi:carbon storage regulator CsrA